MKIGLIVPGFSADESDWCIPAVLNLVNELGTRHDVRVYALRYPGWRGAYRVGRTRVHSFGGREVGGLRRFPLFARAVATVVRHGRRERFDVLHALWADEPGAVAIASGRLLRRPVLVSLMGGEVASLPDIGYGGRLSRTNRWLAGLSTRYAETVTAPSEWLADAARRTFPGRAMRLAPLGVDTGMFRPTRAGRPPGAGPRLLHVASLLPVKGQTLLLRAFAIIAAELPGAHLDVVGGGPEEARLRQLAGALELGPRVVFHGEIPHEQLPRFYRSADLCLLASRHESEGMVVLEAAACGVPTAGTAVGILPEFAPAAGLLVPPEPAGFAMEVLSLLGDDARLRSMSASAQRMAETRFNLTSTASALEDLYREVCGESR